jgi:hypothetical protein
MTKYMFSPQGSRCQGHTCPRHYSAAQYWYLFILYVKFLKSQVLPQDITLKYILRIQNYFSPLSLYKETHTGSGNQDFFK